MVVDAPTLEDDVTHPYLMRDVTLDRYDPAEIFAEEDKTVS